MRCPDTGGVSSRQRAEREDLCLQAADLLDQGVTPSNTARQLRVSTKSTYTWRWQWRTGGREALRPKGPGCATCDLADDQLKRLKADRTLGPVAFNFRYSGNGQQLCGSCC